MQETGIGDVRSGHTDTSWPHPAIFRIGPQFHRFVIWQLHNTVLSYARGAPRLTSSARIRIVFIEGEFLLHEPGRQR